MEVKLIGKPEIIIEAPDSLHGYFAWPSVARLQDGRIAVGCSGFRLEHICPFGKACLAFSNDDGKSYTLPLPVIDTVLDDRDTGVVPFGKSGVIVTSFNNTVEFQRSVAPNDTYRTGYLDKITAEQETDAIGAEFRISFDNCTTFGKIYKSPITSPHGPVELKDGKILWVGRVFSDNDTFVENKSGVLCYEMHTDGIMEKIGTIQCEKELNLCEPHMIECDDGKLLCHLRSDSQFTLYQTESYDKGKTWSVPKRLLEDKGGAPAHLLQAKDGTIISVYGYREFPFGIKMIYSTDNGESWSEPKTIYTNEVSGDLGYPATIQLDDLSFLTVFYAHPDSNSPAVIYQQKWTLI